MTSFRPALCDVHIPEENLMSKFAPYAKAVAAGAVSLAGYLAGVVPTSGGFGDVTVQQWLGGVVVLGATFGVVYRVPNQLSARDLTEREADAQALQAYRDRPQP